MAMDHFLVAFSPHLYSCQTASRERRHLAALPIVSQQTALAQVQVCRCVAFSSPHSESEQLRHPPRYYSHKVSAVLTYASPFFLKRILDAIESPTSDCRVAYLYAQLTFTADILKSQTDLQHLLY